MKVLLRVLVVCAVFASLLGAGTALAAPHTRLGMPKATVSTGARSTPDRVAAPPRAFVSAPTAADAATSVVVGYAPADQAQALVSTLMLGGKQIKPAKSGGFYVVQTPLATTARAFAQQLNAQPGVAYAEPNITVHAMMAPNDPYFSFQWGMNAIGAPAAWDVTRGSGVKVGIVDTGVDYYHPDLSGRIDTANGYDFYNGDSNASDDNGHGTHVAGIVGATTDNGVGLTGVANQCTILPVKALGADGGGLVSDVSDAIRWAADHGCSVITMSLGSSTYSSSQDAAIQYAVSKDCVVVAATGNDGAYGVSYPAADSDVIGVGSIDAADNLSYFSNYGPGCDIVAPGSSIYSTTYDGAYGYMSGTSMATPHVAGVVALIRAKNPTWTRTTVEQQLLSTALDLGSAGRDDYFGCGRLRADAAVGAPYFGTLSGTVTSGEAPISGATVSVPGYAAAITGPDGSYSVSNITPGDYDVTFAKGGYFSQTVALTVSVGSATKNISLVAGEADDEIPGLPVPTSPMTGTLSASDDRVDVFRMYLSAGDSISLTMTGATGTDFDLFVYGTSAQSVWVDPAVDSSTKTSYPEAISFTAPTSGFYYVAGYAYSGSGSYSLGYALTSLTGVLSGTVTSGGAVLSGVTVSVPGYAPTTTSPDGSYLIPGIAAGSHSVTFSKSGYWSQSVVVTIVSGATTKNDVGLVVAVDTVLAGIKSVSPNPAVLGVPITFAGQMERDSLGHSALEYRWSEGATVLSKSPSFSTAGLSVGIHVVDLQVKCDRGVWSPAASVTIAVRAPQSIVTATRLIAPSVVKAKRYLTLTGTVSPSQAPGRVTINLKRLVRGKWRSAGSATVSVTDGRFSYRLKPRVRGRWRIVASYPGGAVGAARYMSSHSGIRTIKVR